jgi:hypothetical protein
MRSTHFPGEIEIILAAENEPSRVSHLKGSLKRHAFDNERAGESAINFYQLGKDALQPTSLYQAQQISWRQRELKLDAE